MNKIITGLVFLALGAWAIASWWWFVLDIIKGLVAILLIVIGLIFVGLGIVGEKNSTGKSVPRKQEA